MLSREVYVFVVCIGALLGYMMGRRWWQIIYVDRVYYFDRPKARTRTKKITKKGELSA